MCGRVIDDIFFVGFLSGPNIADTGVLKGMHQIWAERQTGHRAIIGAHQIKKDFRYLIPFRNDGGSKASGVEN